MIFGKKKLENILEKSTQNQNYWAIVNRQFRKNRIAVWSVRLLLVIFLIALFADFIANEKPLYCKLDNKTYFPILKQYAVDLGLTQWEAQFFQKEWSEHNYESVIYPPIPYSHHSLDLINADYTGPFDEQDVPSSQFWHWLGTDHLGRDVAAGMIRGTRIAMLVGIISMGIATIIGLFLGALAGYFGDTRFRISRIRLGLNSLGFFLAYYLAFNVRGYILSTAGDNQGTGMELLKSLVIFFTILIFSNLLVVPLKKISLFRKKITIPIDIIVMRMIEVMNSIPGLLLILASLAIIDQPSIIYVMVIIGLIRWTQIARFIRAELLRVRSLEYIEAAEAMGFSNWRIIIRHALPNALTPVLITIAFGVASAILIEAFISFLGILPENISWGSMLSLARRNFTAWWLAIFPGVAIFVTVTIFNLIGDGLTEALDPKRKN